MCASVDRRRGRCAERRARFVLDTDAVANVDVIGACTWFTLEDFAATDIGTTVYVNDDQLNSTMQNARKKQEMARVVTERARAQGKDFPLTTNPEEVVKATLTSAPAEAEASVST